MNWFSHHGVWHHDITWLGDIAGITVFWLLIRCISKPKRKYAWWIAWSVSGWTSLPTAVNTHDHVVAAWHMGYVLIGLITSWLLLVNLPNIKREVFDPWWKELTTAWSDGRRRNHANKVVLEAIKAQAGYYKARLAMLRALSKWNDAEERHNELLRQELIDGTHRTQADQAKQLLAEAWLQTLREPGVLDELSPEQLSRLTGSPYPRVTGHEEIV